MSAISRPGVVEDAFAIVGVVTVAVAPLAGLFILGVRLWERYDQNRNIRTVERWQQRRARGAL